VQSSQQRRQRVRDSIRDTTRLTGVHSRRTVISLVVIVVVLVLALTLHGSSSGPSLATSCTTPAVAVSSASTGTGRGIEYAITGPKTGTYVVAVDVSSVSVQGNNVGVTSPHAGFAVALHRGLPSCAADATLPALSPGSHEVELFRDGVVVAKAALH
jgi:hypothetical protein